MFSSHVAWAVYVLIELDKVLNTGNNPKGMIISTDNKMHKSVLHNVLRRLMSIGYIARTSSYNKYRLTVNISQVSIYALVKLFHGDVCIGEIYDHCHTIGKENFTTAEFNNFLSYERDFKESICIRMQETYLCDLKKLRNKGNP